MTMKKAELEKHKAKKIPLGAGVARGGHGEALGKREQALARKRELLERSRKNK
ncbi:MAG TPA: hypothetical protein VFO24_12315 [Usitatibacter sp.]|nr:hypothetical protein [Usitatibacter sp.]